MKPFLGIDMTRNKKSEAYNGEEFMVATPSYTLSRALDESTQSVEELLEQAKLPLPLRILDIICAIIAGLVFVLELRLFLNMEEEISLRQAYENAPWLFIIGTICQVVFILLTVVNHFRSKKILNSRESQETEEDFTQTATAVFDELSVPENACDLDVLSFRYHMKNGQPVMKERLLETAPYTSLVYRAFVKQDTLYLADLQSKYAFPLSQLRAIHTVEKKIITDGWNKEEKLTHEKYKAYKLREDDYGNLYVRSYHILELEREGETWGIYFPNYELSTVEALLPHLSKV